MAEAAYNLCGGNMRDMIRVCTGSFDSIRDSMSHFACQAAQAAVYASIRTTAVSEHVRGKDLQCGVSEHLLVMFRSKGSTSDRCMRAVQYIDSHYVLNYLVQRMDMSVFAASYELGIEIGDRTMQGLYLDKIIHKWWSLQKRHPEYKIVGFDSILCFTGRTSERLGAEGVYWIPRVPNCSSIDAATVSNGVLHVFQFGNKQRFDEEAFIRNLLYPILHLSRECAEAPCRAAGFARWTRYKPQLDALAFIKC
jgi:hypothetical protein